MMMLPSTSSPSAEANRPKANRSDPAFTPASPTDSIEPSLVLSQRPFTGHITAPVDDVSAVPAVPVVAPGFETIVEPPSNDPSYSKRRPSPSLDDQSPNLSRSLPERGDNVSAAHRVQHTKKRRTGPGSRNVANLTPEQLLKKRANDREAQRAIRERTKNQIEALEARIRELTSQEPHQELQKAIRQKEAVEAENARLKDHLATIVASIQPILSGNAATTHNSMQGAQQHQQKQPFSEATRCNEASSSKTAPHLDVDRIPNISIGGEQLQLTSFVDSSQTFDKMQTGVHGAQDSPAYQHRPMKQDWGAFTHPELYNSATAGSDSSEISWLAVDAPIKHVPPTCVLDGILLHLIHERRQCAAEGVIPQEVEGPKYPSVSSLLNRANNSHAHPVSQVMTDILSTFSAIHKLPERVASLYVIFRITRWQINPTEENYALLPEFARPVAAQYGKPHPVWVDYLIFPAMREKFLDEHDPPPYIFDDLFPSYTETLSVNWPYEAEHTLIEVPDGSEVIINPAFRSHFLRFENWTLGEAVAKACPQLRGTYNLKRESAAATPNKPHSPHGNERGGADSSPGHS